jgi:hypothetical protein
MSGAWMFFVIFGSIWLLTRGLSGWGCGTRSRLGEEPHRRESENRLSEQLAEMSARLERLEEERDFYRDLLGSGTRFRQPVEPGSSRTESSRP